ncbi:MAG: pyridoxal-dependent decarboxylase [Nannocystaceae bacterium]
MTIDGEVARGELEAALARVLEVVEAWRAHPERAPLLRAAPEVLERFRQPSPLPSDGEPLADAIEAMIAAVAAGYCNASHRHYHAYFAARVRMEAVIGDLFGAALNQTPAAWRAGPGVSAIEAETLAWIADLVGYGRGRGRGSWPGGVVVGGGHLANLVALKLARDRALGPAIQEEGLAGAPPLRVYMSREGHFSIPRALDLLGLGRRALRTIATDAAGRMDPEALAAAIDEDVAAGVRPLAVVAIAGTSGTGAIDPLAAIAEVAEARGIFFHVDGAAGAAMGTLEGVGERLRGIERADAVTLDPCKWLFVPYGIGVLLTRDGDALARAFPSSSHYWEELEEPDLFHQGPYGSRQVRTLGLWLLLRRLGRAGMHRLLGGLVARARELAARVEASPALELLGPPETAIVALRARHPGSDAAARSALNRRIQRLLLARDQAHVTCLEWAGEVWLRVGMINYTLETGDVDRLVAAIVECRAIALSEETGL